jgi:hypothetical protein
MILLHKRITKDYGVELCLFHKLRQTSDGISFFEATIDWSRYLSDHSPSLRVQLVIWNHTIFEFNYYYLHHRDESEGNADFEVVDEDGKK